MLFQARRCFTAVPSSSLEPVNISDTGEMGASAPVLSGRFGCSPFHPGKRNTGMFEACSSGLSPRATSTEQQLQRLPSSNLYVGNQKPHISVYLSLIVKDLQHLRWIQMDAMKLKHLELQGYVSLPSYL